MLQPHYLRLLGMHLVLGLVIPPPLHSLGIFAFSYPLPPPTSKLWSALATHLTQLAGCPRKNAPNPCLSGMRQGDVVLSPFLLFFQNCHPVDVRPKQDY